MRRIPRNEAERIMAKVAQYAADPASLAQNVIQLAGSSYLRLRVADWRVIMDDQGSVLAILRIGSRGGVYD